MTRIAIQHRTNTWVGKIKN